ncbi:hypothetical protein Tco_0993248 [Tanacetum coccineum]|uniref:No apical meristem-associated C-terminal domain-containing protein n=1 Tax=Tanacetum coccineum TaxID=301880 RepID=A0ABQ5F589_9ASTR
MARNEAEDGDYIQLALIEYQAEYEIPFRLIHCWKELRKCHKWKRVELPNFEADKADKNKRYKSSFCSSEVQRPMGRDLAKKKASASSTSSSSNNEDALARKRELELKAQEIKMRDMEQRLQDIQF